MISLGGRKKIGDLVWALDWASNRLGGVVDDGTSSRLASPVREPLRGDLGDTALLLDLWTQSAHTHTPERQPVIQPARPPVKPDKPQQLPLGYGDQYYAFNEPICYHTNV